MASHSDGHDLILQPSQNNQLHPSGLEPVPARITCNEGVWLFNTDVDSPYRTLELDDAIDTAFIPCKSAVAWLHGRVQNRVLGQDLSDAGLGDTVLVCNLDEAAVLGVCVPRISRPVARKLLGVACGEDFARVTVHKTSPDAELGGRWG